MNTPAYIKALLTPNGGKPAGRRVWSLDLESVWLPFFTATNAMGDTHIAHDALGAPIRLAYAPDGSVKFGKTGRPTTKVAKELADSVKMVRENFATALQSHTAKVIAGNAEGYKAQVELARQAGEPIIARDRASLGEALLRATAEAPAQMPEAEAPIPELVPA